MKLTSTHYLIGVVVVVLVGLGVWNWQANKAAPASPGLISFAQCLKDEGATFYGAFWCPHCQAQKELFGNAAEELPYVECSTPDRQDQTQVCKDNEIKSYPTWVFADGSRQSGEMTLAALASKTGCELPE